MPVTAVTHDLESRTLTITAEFAAPADRVWEVYADPRQLERVWGPPTMEGRTPTIAFTVDGVRPDVVADELSLTGIATWAGHSYALEAVGQLGLAESGGVVRAGVVAYIDDDDVTRLLAEVARLG